MARRFRIRRSEVEEPSINLTPLIDVVFCILIMFIVVAPLLELDRVELADAGQSRSVSVQESGPIAIHVQQDDSVWLNKRMVTMQQLPELLKMEKGKFPGVRPQLFQDKRAHFGIYQSVKNAAESAGFDQLDIILNPA